MWEALAASAPAAPLALSNGSVILIVFFLALPIALALFMTGGDPYSQIGRGGFSLDVEELPQTPERRAADRAEEIRQLVEAKNYRRRQRGEAEVDVDGEVSRLRGEDRDAPSVSRARAPTQDPELREEVRQLVVAGNQRRQRRGEEPLDVEAEVDRQLAELESLGQ